MFRLLLLLVMHSTCAIQFHERLVFLDQFLDRQIRPAALISFMHSTAYGNVETCKYFSKKEKVFMLRSPSNLPDKPTTSSDDNVVYLADLNTDNTLNTLVEAEKRKLLISPGRWILFYNSFQYANNSINVSLLDDNCVFGQEKAVIENKTADLYIPINSEVYIAIEGNDWIRVFLIYRRRPQMPLIWEVIGIWDQTRGFDRARPDASIAMRRRNLEGLTVTAATVILHNESIGHMADYLYRHVDTPSKIMYYMTLQLFDWMNGTGRVNHTTSWGYVQPDGTFQGVVRELGDLRADFSGTVLITMKSRSYAVEFLMEAAPMDIKFIFRKPLLASVTNVYLLPFSKGVWLSIFVLIMISSLALFITSYREMALVGRSDTNLRFRISQGIHDTLCLVFQQGTATDPISSSSRQILLLGLLAFMFLYTAYSANVVAILQSATNDINNVDTLLSSPLQCGTQDVAYMREIFQKEERPKHRQLWLKKGLPQGEQFFLSVEDGIKRVREGMYAFQVEPTAGYDAIKNTFLEHEKCNLGSVKYTDFLYPVVGLARYTHIKEALKIGVYRILEGGVQSRTSRRITSTQPTCGAGAASFAAVSLGDVAPAFHWMCALYGLALFMLAGEIYVFQRGKTLRERRERGQRAEEFEQEVQEI